jgi:hypothetical protein
MAAATIPAPGSLYGPCVKPCKHKDCAQHRADAAVVCSYCNRPCGTTVPVYSGQDGESRLVHAVCLEDAIEKQQGFRFQNRAGG